MQKAFQKALLISCFYMRAFKGFFFWWKSSIFVEIELTTNLAMLS